MSMRKSYHCRIVLMVAGSPVPLLRDAGWSELDHAERHIGPDKDMAVTTGTDFRIDELRKPVISGIATGRQHCRSCDQYQ